jgi:hypothetical protein
MRHRGNGGGKSWVIREGVTTHRIPGAVDGLLLLMLPTTRWRRAREYLSHCTIRVTFYCVSIYVRVLNYLQ